MYHLLVLCFLMVCSATAQANIVGFWVVTVSSPEGPFPLEVEFRHSGSTGILGFLLTSQGKVPISSLTYTDSRISMDLLHSGKSYRMDGTVTGANAHGTWAELGTQNHGTWAAEREPAAGNAQGEISGSWDLRVRILNREMPFLLELRQDGGKVGGMLRSAMASAPIEHASWRNGRLEFTVELSGNVYSVQAELKGGAFEGRWRASGALRALPRASNPIPDPFLRNLEGDWYITESTPKGARQQQMILRTSNGIISGTIGSSGKFFVIRNAAFKDNRLTFEVDGDDGPVRIEASLADGKLQGKWTRIGKNESGTWGAEQRQK